MVKMCDEVQKRRHADGDGNKEKIPELKKARYSWQVKGRCEQETSGPTSTDALSKLPSSESAKVESLPCSVKTALSDSLIEGRLNGSMHDTGKVNGASSSHGHSSKSDLFVNAVTIIKPSEGNLSSQNTALCQSRLNSSQCDTNQSRNRRSAGIIGNASEPESSGNRRGIHINFDTSSFQRPPVNFASYLWQKQEVGCAIVDNVFNKTLEEMGLSPDPKVNLLATTRLTVENRSIEAAIHQQGLVVQRDQSTPSPPPPPPRNSVPLSQHSFSRSVQGNELYNPDVTDNFFRHLLKDNTSKPKPEVSQSTLSVNSLIDNSMSCQPFVSGVKDRGNQCEDGTNENNSKHADAMCSFQEIETDNEMVDNCIFGRQISTENCSSNRSQMTCESTSGAMVVDCGASSGGCSETGPRSDVGSSVKVETDGGPDRVMDLAVSTALMSHGLTLSDSCDS